jgi:hypothetical protein
MALTACALTGALFIFKATTATALAATFLAGAA